MPRKKTLWFRFYVEAIHDRKLRRQPPAARWLWVVILAAARRSPVPGVLLIADDGDKPDPITIDDLVDDAALKPVEVRRAIRTFLELGMLSTDEDLDAWYVTRWWDRQFESDDVTARTAKHRSRERSDEQDRNVPTSSEGTSPSHARASRASHALATEAEAEEVPPQPPPAGGGDPPSDAKLNPRAAGTNPRAIAQRQRTTTSRLEGAQSRGATLALGGSSRNDALATMKREYPNDEELATIAMQAYDEHLQAVADA